MTDNMAVMYAGSIVEMGKTKNVFANPQHSYTKMLLESTPSIVGEKKKLRSLDGEPPSLIDNDNCCLFSYRCPNPTDNCKDRTVEMQLIKFDDEHYVDQCCKDCG